MASLAAALSLGTLDSAAGSSPPAGSWTGHAVIVGIADYPGWGNDLFFSDDDAWEIRNTLLSDTEHWTESNVELLVDSDATVDAIHSAVDAMRVAAGAGDVCVFYFSGHGDFTDRDVAPYDETGPGDKSDEILVAYDGDILDDDLAVWLAEFTSQRVCVIIDSCYSGGMVKSAGGASAASWVSGFAEDIIRARSTRRVKSVAGAKDIDDIGLGDLVALMASEETQLSEEDFILRNGVFTFFVVAAMSSLATDTNGDGFTSAEEVFAYAAPRASDWNPGQTAQIYDTDETSELPLLTAADRGLEPVVTEEDLPFGGGITRGGCLASDPHTVPLGGLAWLVTLGAAATLAWRKRALLALASLVVLSLGALSLGGCLFPYVLPMGDNVRASGADAPAPTGTSVPRGQGTAADSPSELPRPVEGGAGLRLVAGLRAGTLIPLGSRAASYSETASVGVFLAGKLKGVPFELGVDTYRLRSKDLPVAADVLSARIELFVVRGVVPGKRESYFHFGPRVLVDFVKTYWGETNEVAVALGAGVGVRRPGGGWDVRLSADGLVGSSNIAGFLSLNAGWAF